MPNNHFECAREVRMMKEHLESLRDELEASLIMFHGTLARCRIECKGVNDIIGPTTIAHERYLDLMAQSCRVVTSLTSVWATIMANFPSEE